MNEKIKKQYRTIVIDPPWNIGLTGGKLKDTKHYRCGKMMPYKLMTDEEISKFPIDDFADECCDLFLWTTQSKLPIALQILKKWGFKYHCILTWDKTNGIGLNGFHRRTELVLYGYRGKMGVLRTKGRYIPTLFTEKLTTNSTKPNAFYGILTRRTLSPRIDIFARQRREGWDAWGDEIPNETQMVLK